ncbi:MAG: OmpH family outer membrane protein [Flavobacteriales bacterium]|nr:OmpH family outer membrane protein [Flavobacteriales bacterium]
MKKPFAFNLILVILFAGTFVALLVMWSKLNSALELAEKSKVVDTISPGQMKVAYVNLDSLNSQYAFITDKSAELEKSAAAAEAKVKAEASKRQKEVDELVAYAQRGNLPADEQATVQNRLGQLQNELAQIQQREEEMLMQSEAALQEDLRKKLEVYTANYAKANGWDYIFSYQSTAPLILFANPIYDLTSEIVKGLNAEYETEKQGK